MVPKRLKGMLNPDGRSPLPPDQLPEHPVRVVVTILANGEEDTLAELGDYSDQLTDYEDRLARGEIRWE